MRLFVGICITWREGSMKNSSPFLPSCKNAMFFIDDMQQYLRCINQPMTPQHRKNTWCNKHVGINSYTFVCNSGKDSSTFQLSWQLFLHDGNAIECHYLPLMRFTYLVIPK